MLGNIQGSGESARTRECHSASKEGKKRQILKTREVVNVTALWSSKSSRKDQE